MFASLETIRSLREKVNWELEQDRLEFLKEIERKIRRGRAPKLRDFLRTKEIESLLWDSAGVSRRDYAQQRIVASFIEFVVESGYKDEPELDENGEPVLRRTTPIHRAIRREYIGHVVRGLFQIYNRFDANYADESGFTHFHVACMTHGCQEIVEKFLEAGQDPNVVWRETGDSPLHLAVRYEEIVKVLLRSGADPNSTNKHGSTPLHAIYRRTSNVCRMARTLFEFSREPVLANARDSSGNTPLHYAMISGNSDPLIVLVLLENGADPNLANAKGSTPLHTFCQKSSNYELLLALFCICEDEGLPLLIDARDDSGQTPMYHAVKRNSPRLVRLLLEQGADPSSTDARGYTPLHVICQKRCDDDNGLVDVFLDTCEEINKTVLIDTQDKEGLTPLQWAVANYNPDNVDRLLDRGADLESFVFPTARRFHGFVDRLGNGEKIQCITFANALDKGEKIQFAAGILTIVERLEKRGYELDRCDAMTIMRLFDICELFERSANLEIPWGYDNKFKSEAKEYLFHPGLSLYDLMGSRAAEAKRLALADYHRLARSRIFMSFYYHSSVDACERRLCDMLSRRFFRDWALESFLVLIRYRLPILCCDMIIENLTNRDFYNICLAARLNTD